MTTFPLPPGPKGHFLSGNLPEFRRDLLGFLERCAGDHGDFVSFRLGPRRFVLVNDPAAIEDVLVTRHRDFGRNFAARQMRALLGRSLVNTDGDYWLRQRRLMQPAFHKNRIAGYGATMVASAERLLASWRAGETRDIQLDMMRLTLEIAARTLFDADVAGDAREVGSALEEMMKGFDDWLNSTIPLPAWVPTPRNLRLRRAVRRLHDLIDRLIRQRRASGEDRGDLLSTLIHARDEDGGRMTDRQLRDEALTMLLAGHETTALALSWTWFLLSRHPEAAAKLAAEWQAVLGGRSPTVADLPQLRYTEMALQESLRLYPPAYVSGREALRDGVLGGYRVPAGTSVMISQWLLHRDPRYFDRPGQFDPERWADGLAQRLPKFAYFPFGGGPRVCIGRSFALMEATLVLATIGQQFRLDLEPGHEVTPWPSFTLRPRQGVKVVLVKREKSAVEDERCGASCLPLGSP
jgi:cytochrome P450